MADIENEQNKVVGAMEVFGDIFFTNVLFILFSLPVITIGASITASYYVMMKMVRKEGGGIFKRFFHAFKLNFVKSTICWIGLLLVATIMAGEFIFIANTTGFFNVLYTIVLVIEILMVLLVFPFLFPLVARFENSIGATLKNAFLLSVSNLGAAVKILLCWIMPFALCIVNPEIILHAWYLWLLLVFGFIFYLSSFALRRVFDRVENVKEREAEKKLEKEIDEKQVKEAKRKKLVDKVKKLNDEIEDL